VWNNWIVFPEHRIAEYNSIFMQPGTEPSVADVPSDQPMANSAEVRPEGEPVGEEVQIELDTNQVEDEYMDDDIDGEPLSDIDGEPLTDDEEDEEMENVGEKEDVELEDMFA
jgi:hypothetical protein